MSQVIIDNLVNRVSDLEKKVNPIPQSVMNIEKTAKDTVTVIESKNSDLKKDVYANFDNFKNKIEHSIKEIPLIKDLINKVDSKVDNYVEKTSWQGKELYELRSDISAYKEEILTLKKELSEAVALCNTAVEVISVKVNTEIDKRVNEYQRWINQEYYDLVNRSMILIEDILKKKNPELVNSSDFQSLKENLSQSSLQNKWDHKKKAQGQSVLNRAEEIIAKRDLLHEEMIKSEREGKNVDDLKKKIEVYEEILEMIK